MSAQQDSLQFTRTSTWNFEEMFVFRFVSSEFWCSETILYLRERFCAECNKSVICFTSASVLLHCLLLVGHTRTPSLSLHSLWSFPDFAHLSECPSNLWSPVQAAHKCMLQHYKCTLDPSLSP